MTDDESYDDGHSSGKYDGFHSRDNEVYNLKYANEQLESDMWDKNYRISELESKISQLESDKRQLEYEKRTLENSNRQYQYSNWG